MLQKLCCTGVFCIVFSSIFSAFCSKIEKNMAIFCNFFSLCINKLEES